MYEVVMKLLILNENDQWDHLDLFLLKVNLIGIHQFRENWSNEFELIVEDENSKQRKTFVHYDKVC
jgi:hypothetical protein